MSDLWYWLTLTAMAVIGINLVIQTLAFVRLPKAWVRQARRREYIDYTLPWRAAPTPTFPWGQAIAAGTLFVAAVVAFSGVYFGWREDRREATEAALRVQELELRVAELRRTQNANCAAIPAAPYRARWVREI